MDINNTNFYVESTTYLNQQKKEFSGKKSFLKLHQYIINKYFINSAADFRGMLIYFGTGQGKTILSVSIAEYYRTLGTNRKIIILAAKSLQSNYVDGIAQYLKGAENKTEAEIDQIIGDNYKFVTSNASNMIKQFQPAATESLFARAKNTLNNSLLIVDEAHNLMNSITNGSKMALQFYDMVLRAKNIKIIFLSGTPIVNTPFEMVPMFNMLFGESYFPEYPEKFNKLFIENDKIKNKDKLANYLTGRISYFGSRFLTDKQAGFPRELPLIIEKVQMSPYQYNLYNGARALEKIESAKVFSKKVVARFGNGKKSQSTYRVKTRQISNFAFPEHVYKKFNDQIIKVNKMRNAKEMQKLKKILKIHMVGALTAADLSYDGLKKYSPKMLKIINNINAVMLADKMIGMVYSGFVTGEGLGIFEKVLQNLGWKKYTPGAKSTVYTYAVISGEVPPEERSLILKTLNSPANKFGELINLLLVSSTGAEGLDLKGVRHVHIMDPYWNMARIHQIMARGIRYNSHTHLPVDKQDIQVFIYLSVFGDNLTTDEYIYDRAVDGQKLIDEFLDLFISVSVDCEIHTKVNCRICRPNNKKLYYSILSQDILDKNSCIELQPGETLTKEVTAEELVLDDGRKLYYTVEDETGGKKILDRIHIYEYVDSLANYAKLSPHSAVFPAAIEKILSILGL